MKKEKTRDKFNAMMKSQGIPIKEKTLKAGKAKIKWWDDKEKTLSDKRIEGAYPYNLHEDDVKEFLKKLKDKIDLVRGTINCEEVIILIDSLAGEELVK